MTAPTEQEIEIKKFDMRKVGDEKICVFIGKRKTGKSWAVKDLLYYNRHIPTGIVMSGTEKANKFYGKIIPEVFIHDDFNKELISGVIERQQGNINKLRKKYPDATDEEFAEIAKEANCGSFIILDDLMYDQKWVRDKNVAEIFMNGRHYKILFVVTMQYPLGILPNLRTNVDYVFIFRENNMSNRKKIYEHYAGVFPTFDQFCQVMDECTSDYGCLVIDNGVTSTKMEDVVYWYRASDHGEFKVGSRKFWDFGESQLDENGGKKKKNERKNRQKNVNLNIVRKES